MMKKKILIVDDEHHILELLRYNLEEAGYEVLEADHGDAAVNQLANADAAILDIMLPGIDGIELLRRIRKESRYIPVIMLTAKNEEIDVVLGLELGADDYISKPFRPRELISRLKNVLRRRTTEHEKAEHGITLDRSTMQVFVEGREKILTLKEFELLEKLMSAPERVFSRNELLETIWGFDYAGETRTVDVHIRQLRKKLEQDDANPKRIITVRGIGYKYRRS